MARQLEYFERVVRRSYGFTEQRHEPPGGEHAFDQRNIHDALPSIVKALFDDGHYSQATFEAFKYVDKQLQILANSSESGFKLMLQAFAEKNPMVQLTPCKSVSERGEQKGYQFLFAGSMLAIRNPRGHEVALSDGPDTCLDHLSLASLLIRRLEDAGYAIPAT